MSTTPDTTPEATPRPPRGRSTRLSRRARWGVPAVAVIAVAGAIGVPLMSADASPNLPPKTAGQLLADLASAQARPFSGTVVETARLGFPAVPGETSNTSPLSLLTGSHTVRIWYGGAQQTRLALVGDLAESDLVRNGTDLWLWSSKDKTAQHMLLPAKAAQSDPATQARRQALEGLTPAQAAAQALASVDPTTAVSVDGTARVAGRAVYELVLRPRDARSLVSSVRLAVDSRTHVPLRVQVFGSNHTDPAFETGFTTVTFTKPPASVFRFTAPPDTKVTTKDLTQESPSSKSSESPESHAVAPGNGKKSLQDNGSQPRVIGTGWTSIVEMTGVDLTGAAKNESAQALLKSLKPVSGAYGTGRVLKTSVLSVLVLDNGLAYIGAVPPSMLEAAASAAATSGK
jgi:outer membrane lipoprotein-sorting protein